jgi:hypothetical protein
MKDAYSNLLGEYVVADEVEAGDIAGFQIVCPCCREPIKKGHKPTATSVSYYFSHFKISAAFDEFECERRVGGISSDDKRATNQRSRKRMLDAFRAVIRDALFLLPIGDRMFSAGEGPVTSDTIRIGSHISRFLVGLHKKGDAIPFLRSFVERNNEYIAAAGYENLSTFASSVQTRIAADLFLTLATSNSAKTIHYLVHRGFLATHVPTPRGTAKYSGRAAKLSRAWAQHGIWHTGDFQADGRHVIAMMITDAVMRELLRLPYVRMISNVNAGLPPLTGISLADCIADAEMTPDAREALIDDGFTAKDYYAPEELPPHLRF